jgi:hypothetical protein
VDPLTFLILDKEKVQVEVVLVFLKVLATSTEQAGAVSLVKQITDFEILTISADLIVAGSIANKGQ